MQTQRAFSLFSAGMSADVDPHQQPPSTYRAARNLRLLYNTDPAGAPTEGKSLSLEILAGTQKAWSLRPGYTQIGEIDTPLGLAVLSHNGTYSEIGFVDYDSDGINIKPANAYRPDGFRYSYFTLYNDQYDPNGEKLGLPASDHIQLTTTTENSLITRIEWVDGTHGLRTLNLKLAYHPSGMLYHDEVVSGALAKYPRHLSAHQMDVLPAVQFGDLDYQQRIDGSLLSGGYQVTYRYRSLDGHASPWAPIHTKPYFVSDKPIPTNYTFSHHTRYMGASGVSTTDGMQFILHGVDLRWDTLEVATLYHRGAVGVERALLTHRITLSTNPADAESLTIEVKDFSGTALNVADFLSQQQAFDKVQTLASAHNQLYLGGVVLAKNLALDTSRVSYKFCEQTFLPDETLTPTFKETVNPENPARKDGDKLTNSKPSTGARAVNLFNDKDGFQVLKFLPVDGDYNHNKGVQVSTRLVGYRRYETYPFGALCIDTRGIPYFVVPLKDVTFPSYADSPPSRKAGAVYQSVHLGVSFDGIRIPYEVAYDSTGKRRLGSIMIVRGEASGRIGFQAAALNCCVTQPENKTTIESDQGYKKIEPHPSWNNGFKLENSGIGGGPSHYGAHHTKSTNSNVWNQGAILEISWKGRTDDPMPTVNKPYWIQLHAPDVLTTGNKPDLNTDPSARLQMIGAAHGSYGNEIRMAIAERPITPTGWDGPLHVYTKNYKTNGQLLTNGEGNGRPKLGGKTRIKTWFSINKQSKNGTTYADIDPENDKLFFDAEQSIMTQYREGGFANTNQPEYRFRFGSGGNPRPGQNKGEWNFVDGVLAPGSIVACVKDWEAVDVIENKDSYVSLAIVNYVKEADPQPAADERRYVPTGYLLNTTDEVLAQLPTEKDASGRIVSYVINGAEVYGGDTYVNFVDFTRLYPLWNEGCERRNTYTPDFGVGHILPIESKFNYALRQGRSLANNGMYSQEAACENRFQHATNGVAWGQPEEWNINDVLTPKESIALYKPLPVSVKLTDDRPYSVYASQPKLYGERDDSYRQWRPLDYNDLDGTKGPIIRMETLLGGIYIWQKQDYGRLRARDRAIIPTSVGELTTGTGKDLDGVDYAGQDIGLHQFDALVNGGGRVYWLDSERKLLCRMSQAGKDELSEREHQHDLLTTTIPDRDVSGVQLGLDNVHGDLWLTYGRFLTSQTRTVLYNEKLDVFTCSDTDCAGKRYISWRGKFYGVAPKQPFRVDRYGAGKAGLYFDESYQAELDWVSNPAPMYPKVFDNIGLTLRAPQALVSLQMSTLDDTQSVDLRLGKDPRVAYRQGRLWFPLMNLVPRNGHADPRLRAHYLRLLLTIDPAQLGEAERFTLTAAELLYRLSPKV